MTARPTRARFDVWAPRPEQVRLVVGGETVDMTRGDDDWWTPTGPIPGAGSDPDADLDYGYLLDNDPTPRPDPRSRRQPDGSMRCRGRSTRRRTTGATATGPAVSWRGR